MEKLLESQLKIPIDRYVDFGSYIEIIYKDQNIGIVACISTPGNRILDTSPGILNRLRWDFIYRENHGDLATLAAEYLNSTIDKIQVTIGNYRKIYVRDLEGNILGSLTCSFEKGFWRVEKSEDFN